MQNYISAISFLKLASRRYSILIF